MRKYFGILLALTIFLLPLSEGFGQNDERALSSYADGVRLAVSDCGNALAAFDKAIGIRAKDGIIDIKGEPYYERGRLKYKTGRKESYFPHREKGICLYELGRIDEAEQELRTSKSQHRTEKCEEFLQRIQKDPKRQEAEDHFKSAGKALKSGDYKVALADIKQASEIFPAVSKYQNLKNEIQEQWGATLYERAESSLRDTEYETALESIDMATKVRGTNIGTYRELRQRIVDEMEKNKCPRADRLFADAGAIVLEGDIKQAMLKVKSAADLCETYANGEKRLIEEHAGVLCKRARSLRRDRDYDEALDLVDLVLKYAPDTGECGKERELIVKALSESFLDKAIQHRQRKEFERALQLCEKVSNSPDISEQLKENGRLERKETEKAYIKYCLAEARTDAEKYKFDSARIFLRNALSLGTRYEFQEAHLNELKAAVDVVENQERDYINKKHRANAERLFAEAAGLEASKSIPDLENALSTIAQAIQEYPENAPEKFLNLEKNLKRALLTQQLTQQFNECKNTVAEGSAGEKIQSREKLEHLCRNHPNLPIAGTVKAYLKENQSTFETAERQLEIEKHLKHFRDRLSEADTSDEVGSILKEIQDPSLADACARIGYTEEYNKLQQDAKTKYLGAASPIPDKSESELKLEALLEELWDRLSKARTNDECGAILKDILRPDLVDECERIGYTAEYNELKEEALNKYSESSP